MQFAVRAVRFCRTLPDTWEARRIGGQLIDSSTSVAMNYRAAGRGRTHREFTAKLGLVTEEADETLGWLELITQLNLAQGPDLIWLLCEAGELVAIFGSSYATAKEKEAEQRRSVSRGLRDRRSPDHQSPDPDRRSPDRRSPDSSIGGPP